MSEFTNPLSGVKIASPCPADWNSMLGSERVRFCGQCRLNVYNLSAMTQDDAEALITNYEGRLCLRFYRRRDGSILTEDCPVGLARLKRRATRWRRAFATAVLGFLAGGAGSVGMTQLQKLLKVRAYGGDQLMGAMVAPKRPVNDKVLIGEMVKREDRPSAPRKPAKRQ
jgi:hypothetical protein